MSDRATAIVLELTRLTRVAVGLQARYQAHFQLHSAACLNGNREELTKCRDDLHTVLDALLDNGEAVQKLSDDLTALTDS